MTSVPPSRPMLHDAAHPSGDNRFKLLEATMKKHHYQPHALIEVLHKAQELFGFLEADLLLMIAHKLKLPPSRVYGVATFYHFFSLAPKGNHTCVVCLGTACYVKGAATILAAAEQHTGIHAGETTIDNQISLLTARCLGACGIAPAVVFDGSVAGHQTVEAVTKQLVTWQHDIGAGHNGAVICQHYKEHVPKLSVNR
jgi:bidirectional [NiFe] hydrogenase diaphorase subunit